MEKRKNNKFQLVINSKIKEMLEGYFYGACIIEEI